MKKNSKFSLRAFGKNVKDRLVKAGKQKLKESREEREIYDEEYKKERHKGLKVKARAKARERLGLNKVTRTVRTAVKGKKGKKTYTTKSVSSYEKMHPSPREEARPYSVSLGQPSALPSRPKRDKPTRITLGHKGF